MYPDEKRMRIRTRRKRRRMRKRGHCLHIRDHLGFISKNVSVSFKPYITKKSIIVLIF